MYTKHKWLSGSAERNALLDHLIDHITFLASALSYKKTYKTPLNFAIRIV